MPVTGLKRPNIGRDYDDDDYDDKMSTHTVHYIHLRHHWAEMNN
jgi:hypothetical protein